MECGLYNGSVSLDVIRLYEPDGALYAGYSDVQRNDLIRLGWRIDNLIVRTFTIPKTKTMVLVSLYKCIHVPRTMNCGLHNGSVSLDVIRVSCHGGSLYAGYSDAYRNDLFGRAGHITNIILPNMYPPANNRNKVFSQFI